MGHPCLVLFPKHEKPDPERPSEKFRGLIIKASLKIKGAEFISLDNFRTQIYALTKHHSLLKNLYRGCWIITML